jgi:hypothetical protein
MIYFKLTLLICHLIQKTFDAVTCFQVIEHARKLEGFEILKEISKISKKIVVITTPVGFVEATVDPLNPSQKHKSGWLPMDFKKLGFSVKGYRGPRVRSVHNKIFPFVFMLGTIFLPIFYHFPIFAYHMWCVEKIGE